MCRLLWRLGQGRGGMCASCVPTRRKGQGPRLWCAVVRPLAPTLGAGPRYGRATPADSKGLGGRGLGQGRGGPHLLTLRDWEEGGWSKAEEGHTC